MIPFILTLTVQDGLSVSDKEFLEELFNKYSAKMYYTAKKILINKEDSEDALQDTFIKIYKNIEKFRALSGDDLILLIIVYTRNAARDIQRKKNVALNRTAQAVTNSDDEEIYTDFCDPNAFVEDIVINNERILQTANYIDSLPEKQRDVIIMKYRLNMKEREIAQVLGISETAVSSRVLRAKDGLRNILKNNNLFDT